MFQSEQKVQEKDNEFKDNDAGDESDGISTQPIPPKY